MTTRVRCVPAAVVWVIVLTAPSFAFGSGFISTTGAVAPTAVPASVVFGALESDSTIALIQERLGAILTSPLAVDVDGAPGLYDRPAGLRPGFSMIPAGTQVDVHLLHFDPVTLPQRLNGTVTFQRPIIGLSFTRPRLFAGDAWGAPGTVYPTEGNVNYREFELTPGQLAGDSAAISADRRTLTVDWGVTVYYDELRVFTAVPEPSSAVLAACGTGLFAARRSLRLAA